jgi:hypothetical protein
VAVQFAPVRAAVPTPTMSAAFGAFTRDSNSTYGFSLLRPASWKEIDFGGIEQYAPVDPAKAQGDLDLGIVNLKTQASVTAAESSSTTVAESAIFEAHPSMSGWSAGIEALWRSIRVPFQLISRGPKATIYAMSPVADELQLVALVVSNGQPLQLSLRAKGELADLATLTSGGVVADFQTMAESVSTAPLDHQLPLPARPETSPAKTETSLNPTYVGPYKEDTGTRNPGGGPVHYRWYTWYYDAPPMVDELYEWAHYDLYTQYQFTIGRVDVTLQPDLSCAYGSQFSEYERYIGKHTTQSNGTVYDDYYPQKIVAELGPDAYDMVLEGVVGFTLVCNTDIKYRY